MNTPTRRGFLQLGGITMAAGLALPRLFAGAAATRPGSGQGIPMIHATDLFHPHNDPDDHWDLASVYAAIFDAPCPIYWLPCKNEHDAMAVGTNGSYWRFLQGDILPHLPAKLQNFLLFMLGRKVSHAWFSDLRSAPEPTLLQEFGAKFRNMWCTAGFLHAAGLKVTAQGAIVPHHAPDAPLFTFRPIQVQCDALGVTTWKPADHSRDRFILHIEDVANYPKAMTLALKSLLETLPA